MRPAYSVRNGHLMFEMAVPENPLFSIKPVLSHGR